MKIVGLQTLRNVGLSPWKVSIYYGQAASVIREASPSIKRLFPLVSARFDRRPPYLTKLKSWFAHTQSKALHFDAAAQYRKANEELENKRYGRAHTTALVL